MLSRVERQKNVRYTLPFIAALLLLAGCVLALARGQSSIDSMRSTTAHADLFGRLPLSFEPNVGQTDNGVRFVTHASGSTLLFMTSGLVLHLPGGQGASNMGAEAVSSSSILSIHFLGASSSPSIKGNNLLPGKVNYLRGSDASQWRTDIPTYSEITYSELYPGINLTYTGAERQLKGTYTVAAGADPSRIAWRYSSPAMPALDSAGSLQVTIGSIMVSEEAPIAWQQIGATRIEVKSSYQLRADGSVGFALGKYDPTYPLIIDPTLTYSTYLGGSFYDYGQSIAVDASGNAYLTGRINSLNWPTQNPYQPSYGGGFVDAFVTKMNPTGSALVYSTYLGGNGWDEGNGVAVDSMGSVYVSGVTTSTNFPLMNPFQPAYGGGSYDAFVTKLTPAGNALVYSTFLGGNASDFGYAIAVDPAGNAHAAGRTNASNFPVQSAFQATNAGGYDAFLTKFNSSGSALVYSTYLGGSGGDGAYGVALDGSGSPYLTGYTGSGNFPRLNPIQPTYGGGNTDSFVTKFNPAASALVYSTYLGGITYDYGQGIAVDGSGGAYIGGYTDSANFPLSNPVQPQYGGGVYDAFVTKVNPAGSAWAYSTYLGGSMLDRADGIAVDSAGNAHITGRTTSTDYPTVNPIQSTHAGGDDAIAAKLNATGSALLYSTYLGGDYSDWGHGIAVDAAGSAYLIGDVNSFNFPIAGTPFQPTNAGGSDVFVSKISDQTTVTPSVTVTPVPPTASSTVTPVLPTLTTMPTSTPVLPTVTGTSPPTIQPSATATNTNVAVTQTATPAQPTSTTSVTATSTSCPLTFSDVPQNHTFYASVRCLACRGIVSGYADGTFRPDNLVTRGQLAKIVSNAANFTEPPGPQIFQDVPTDHTFYEWINRLTNRGYMGGYSCGSPGEPCVNNRPYFRPFANATRAQTSKIVSNAARYNDPPTGQTFEDVPPTHPFYVEIQRLASRNIMGGYNCGGPGEPCVNNRPYFRPYNDVTRGQSAKIVANTFYPDCQTPALP